MVNYYAIRSRYSTCLGDALRDHRIRVGEGCVRQAVAKRPQHSIAARQRGVDPAGASRGWLVVVVAGEDVRRCWEADRPALLHYCIGSIRAAAAYN